MSTSILHKIYQAKAENRRQLAVLIDPDTPDDTLLGKIVEQVNQSGADLIFLGGSLLVKDALDDCIRRIKSMTDTPVILFPGSVLQISPEADAILFLSLISGRNPELLIGSHVISAPYIRQAKLETLPTGYMLIDSGKPTTASYMSGSLPIPYDKDDVAACTAMAGEMLGQKLIYMDGGSGAEKAVSTEMIAKVRQSVQVPIIIGGGIKSGDCARKMCEAGADIIVVGNASESNPGILREIAEAVHNV